MAKAQRRSAATDRPLTPKQQMFCREYLVDLNAAQASIRAGYSPKTAKEQGHRLLTNAHIQQAIQEHRAHHAANTGLSIERVLLEAQRLAFFDIRKLVDKDGNPIPVNQLDDDTAAAIQGLELASERSRDEEGTETTVRKYKVADKNSALERLFKHLGLFERDNKQSNPGGAMADFIAELAARGSRLPIKGSGK